MPFEGNANNTTYWANNDSVIWWLTAMSLSHTCLPECYWNVTLEMASSKGHFVLAKLTVLPVQRTQTHTNAHAGLAAQVCWDANSFHLSEAGSSKRRRPSRPSRTWFLLGTLFPFSAFEGKLTKPRLFSSEYIWPIKKTRLSRVLLHRSDVR